MTNCPNCQADINGSAICRDCGVDIVLYKHSVLISDRLYNQGLRYLKSGDITHGIKNLTKCVTINKNHVAARNLLGLALFEIGHVGEAVKHWILSQSLMSEANPATKYIEITEQNVAILEDYDEAITRYNRALEFLKSRNDTAAVVQLKTAVDLNPRFIDALNMLALCYLIKNNIEAAMPLIERVLKIDPMNPVAKNYDSIVNPSGKKRQRTRSETRPIPQMPKEEPPVVVKSASSFMVKILLFVLGFAAAFVLLFFMIIQPTADEHAETLDTLRQEWAEREAYLLNNLTNINSELSAANNRISNMEIEIHNHENTIRRMHYIINITQAYIFYRNGYLRDAMDLIDDAATETNLPSDEEIQRRLEVVIENAYPRLADYFFIEGNRHLEEDRPEYALEAFEHALRFFAGDMDAEEMPELLFLLGTLYIEFDRNREAFDYLSMLQDYFPDYSTQAVEDLLESISDPPEPEIETEQENNEEE